MAYGLGLCKTGTNGSAAFDWYASAWQPGDSANRRKILDAVRASNPGVYGLIIEFADKAAYDAKEQLVHQASRDSNVAAQIIKDSDYNNGVAALKVFWINTIGMTQTQADEIAMRRF